MLFIVCLLLFIYRNVACHLATVTSLSTTVFRIARRTFTHTAGRCAPAVTSLSPVAVSRQCTASITQSISLAHSVSASSTRAHSRRRTTNHTVIHALYDSSADHVKHALHLIMHWTVEVVTYIGCLLPRAVRTTLAQLVTVGF